MEIREADERDIPEIISLLKLSLGETLMPKSEGFWCWKHVANPFGRSPVLVAAVDNRIIGVRALMRWAWRKEGGRTLQAVRAVDTATHPDFQGQGIFSKLTMALIDRCVNQGIDLVFNTPNKSSMPGYLKMGWRIAGKLPVNVRVINPLRMAWQLVVPKSNVAAQDNSSLEAYLNHPGLEELLRSRESGYAGRLITPHSRQILRWRYLDVPVATYLASGVGDARALESMIIYRLKQSRLGLEFRIVDVFARPGAMTELGTVVLKEARSHGADYVTMCSFPGRELLRGGLSFFNRSVGPIVTVRPLQMENIGNFVSFSQWAPSLGDLELF